jgi:hypothetical protein
VRIVLDPDATPVAKGKLCGQQAGFNLHAQTKVAANDKKVSAAWTPHGAALPGWALYAYAQKIHA